jgi:hypothetical protein
MQDGLVKIFRVVWAVWTFVWKQAYQLLKWCQRLTDRIAKKTGYAVAYLIVGLIFGPAIGLFVGGMGLALLGTAIPLSGLFIFTVLGALVGSWAGLLRDRITPNN